MVLEWYENIKAFRRLVRGEERRGHDGFGTHTWRAQKSYEEKIGG
jgi:hypothetical protein